MSLNSEKIKVLYLPNRIHTERVFTEETFARLNSRFDVTQLAKGSEGNCTSEQVAEAIPGFAALITGWGTPRLTPEVFEYWKGMAPYAAIPVVKRQGHGLIIGRLLP